MLRDPENLEYLNLHQLVDFAGLSVLEIGCGSGRMVEQYRDLTRLVAGIDLDIEDLEIARDDGIDSTHFLQADAITLPFREAAFDVVLFSWSL